MCVCAGDPSAKDLEQLFSLGSLSSPASNPQSSGLRTKRGPSRSEKRKSGDRRSLSDSPHTHRKDNLSKSELEPRDAKDAKGPRVKEPGPIEAPSEITTPQAELSEEAEPPEPPKLPKPEVTQVTVGVKLHRLESRKCPRRETAVAAVEPEVPSRGKREVDHEQEERRKKRRSEAVAAAAEVKNTLISKHLEKTVSIRLVDIRNSDTDDYFFDERLTKRSSASIDVTTANTKLNKAGVALDAAKANGWLRKPHATSNGHLKSWGKFRIPKRSERPEAEEAEPRKPLLRPLTNTPETSPSPSPSYPRTRLRTGTENDGYASDSKPGDGDVEPCLKRCHSHQLRGDSSLGRRYGSDIIRRGVLAS